MKDEVDEDAAVKTIAPVMEHERAKCTTPPHEQSEGSMRAEAVESMFEEAAIESGRQPVWKQPMDVIRGMPAPLRSSPKSKAYAV